MPLILLSNYNRLNTIRFLIPRLVMEFISTIKDLFSLRPLHAFSQIRALLWIIFHPNVILNKRFYVKELRQVSDSEILNNVIFNKSIVYQYFVKNIKEYSNL